MWGLHTHQPKACLMLSLSIYLLISGYIHRLIDVWVWIINPSKVYYWSPTCKPICCVSGKFTLQTIDRITNLNTWGLINAKLSMLTRFCKLSWFLWLEQIFVGIIWMTSDKNLHELINHSFVLKADKVSFQLYGSWLNEFVIDRGPIICAFC